LLRHFGSILLFLVLTLITQVGGLIYLVVLLAGRHLLPSHWGISLRWVVLLPCFLLLYGGFSAYLVPTLAEMSGRVPLQCQAKEGRPYAARNAIFCLLNRHYVSPQLRDLLTALSLDLAEAHPGTLVAYLDAGFPFFDGFPLLPHLSHRDGRKLDIAFFYGDSGGYRPAKTPSPLGYWGYERPRPGQAAVCPEDSGLLSPRWDLDWLQPWLPKMQLGEARMGALLDWLDEKGPAFGLERVFLEPHLLARLERGSPLFRFQGCRAARHDDHIHIQVGR
jgi:hypothetical protein